MQRADRALWAGGRRPWRFALNRRYFSSGRALAKARATAAPARIARLAFKNKRCITSPPNYGDKSRISSADCQAANFGWNETRSACALIICIQNALRLMHGNARNASWVRCGPVAARIDLVNGPRRFEIILPAELRGRSLLWPMRLAQARRAWRSWTWWRFTLLAAFKPRSLAS